MIGSNPKEHGLKDVHTPAMYSMRSDFTDSTEESMDKLGWEREPAATSDADAEEDGWITVLARANAAFSALNTISSNPKKMDVDDDDDDDDGGVRRYVLSLLFFGMHCLFSTRRLGRMLPLRWRRGWDSGDGRWWFENGAGVTGSSAATG